MAYTTINKGSSYFNTVLYTGTGTTGGNTLAVTGVNFQPDFLWVKNRTVAVHHYLYDIVRGTGSAKALGSSTTASESTFSSYADNGGVASLDSNGFTAYRGTDNTYQGTNLNGNSYVAWNWLAGGTGVSNTSGSISSTVSANTTSGFSIVSWTASGATSTVGHGLGTTPSMIIFKDRSNVTNWFVYHKSIGATGALYLNATNSTVTNSIFFNNTSPTSSVFTVSTYLSASPYIAYCFAEVKGYSKFGSYTGNGSADGTFVYTGFKPAFFMVKRTDTTGSWIIVDNKRNTTNPETLLHLAHTTSAEENTTSFSAFFGDFLSNGVKLRDGTIYTGGTNFNISGGTYIYMAFAENPFTSSKGIPCTAR